MTEPAPETPVTVAAAAPDALDALAAAAQAAAASAGPGARGLQDILEAAFADAPAMEDGPAAATDLEACLAPILTLLNWPGDARGLFEAKPHLEPIEDIDTLRSILSRLGFRTISTRYRLDKLPDSAMPAILHRPGVTLVLVGRDGDGDLVVYDAMKRDYRKLEPSRASETLFVVTPVNADPDSQRVAQANWFKTALGHFRRPIAAVVLLTFIANLVALATPLYTANVYNHVIGPKAPGSLLAFFVAVCVLLTFDSYLRRLRAQVVAYVGARFHAALANAAFEKVLLLPIAMVEQSSVGSQITRFRQFESIRMFFTSHLVNTLLDLPFIIVFFFALGMAGGIFVLVPFALAMVYAVLAAIAIPISKRHVAHTGAAQSKAQAFVIESLSKAETIRQLGAEAIWTTRYQALTREAVLKKFTAGFFDNVLQTVAQSLSTVAGVATLGIGATMVMNGSLSVGGLIAVMMYIWRLLAPIQAAFLGMSHLGQFADSIRQVNALMRLNTERNPARKPVLSRKLNGRITLDGIVHRYPGRIDAALKGIGQDIPAGQIVALIGAAGAGKSTLLKMILGFYQPAAGTVYLDGLNLQQLDLGQTRAAIGYTPQDPVFFFGTVAQNLLLSNPSATEPMMWRALEEAGLGREDPLLPQGLATKLMGSQRMNLSESTRMRLSLARAYVKNPPILLLDDPGAYLDRAGDEAFLARLASLRGKATVLLVTNRPSHMRMCDRIIRLDRGLVVADGTPAEILDKVPDPRRQEQARRAV